MNKLFRLLTAVIFLWTSLVPPSVAEGVSLPAAQSMIMLTPDFSPCLLRGIRLDPKMPLRFEFIVDEGDTHLKSAAFEDEAERLIKYFMATLTTPEKDLWVNLSPYENDRIVQDNFGRTAMGRDLLAQDYILKQLTASLMHPDGELGKKFWGGVYRQAQEKFGTTDIPIDTFNKVWIVPEYADVYEKKNQDGTMAAFVDKARLKVMLESDYLAKARDESQEAETADAASSQGTQEMAQEVVRSVILPALEKEVNQGSHFAQLRQVYHSLLLAVWLKKKLQTAGTGRDSVQNPKGNILSLLFVDKKKTSGIETDDPKGEITNIYDRYVEAFKTGAYNLIREDYDLYSKEVIPRKYFSGGFSFEKAQSAMVIRPASSLPEGAMKQGKRVTADFAMASMKKKNTFFRAVVLIGVLSLGAWGGREFFRNRWAAASDHTRDNKENFVTNIVSAAAGHAEEDLKILEEEYKMFEARQAVSPDLLQAVQLAIDNVTSRVRDWERGGKLSEEEVLSRMSLSLEDLTRILQQVAPLMVNFNKYGFSDAEKKEIVLGLAYKESSFGLNQIETKSGKPKGRGILQYDKVEIFLEDLYAVDRDPRWQALAREKWPDLFQGGKVDPRIAQAWMHDSELHLVIGMFRMDRVMGRLAALLLKDTVAAKDVSAISRGTVKVDMPRDVVCPAFQVYEKKALKVLLVQGTLMSWNVGSNRGHGFYHTVIGHIFLANSFSVTNVGEMREMRMLFNEPSEKAFFHLAAQRVYGYYGITLDKRFLLGPLFGQAWENAYKASQAAGYRMPPYYKFSTLKAEHSQWMNKNVKRPAAPKGTPSKKRRNMADRAMLAEPAMEKSQKGPSDSREARISYAKKLLDELKTRVNKSGFERLAYWEDQKVQEDVFAEIPVGSRYLGAGLDALVIEKPDGKYVLRIKAFGKRPKEVNGLLQPVEEEEPKRIGDFLIEVLPKVQTNGLKDRDILVLEKKLNEQGFTLNDVDYGAWDEGGNLGKLDSGEAVVVDTGAIKTLNKGDSSPVFEYFRQKYGEDYVTILEGAEPAMEENSSDVRRQALDALGGIDLNTDRLDMFIKGNAGNFDMELTPEQLRMLQQGVTGFVPVIIGVKPLESVPGFLGMKEVSEKPLT